MKMLALALALLLAPVLAMRPAGAACRELDLTRSFPRAAHAAEADATIQYFGHNFFQITTRKGTRIVTDPLAPGMYPTPHIAPHVVTIGREHPNHNFIEIAQGNPIVMRGLAHYGAEWNRVSATVRDVFIYNLPVYQNGVEGALKGAAFIFDLGVLCIAHLGDLSHKLTPEQLKQIGKIDVALVPIDGRFTMPADTAREVVGQLQPKIAIPMHYRDNLSLVRLFSRGLNARYLAEDTLTVSQSALPQTTEIVVLRPRGAFYYE